MPLDASDSLYIYMLSAKYEFGPPRIRTQSSRIMQPNLGHPRQQTHDRLRSQSSSAIRGNEPTIINHRCLQSRSACAIDRASLPQMGELLACAIVRGLFAAEGRTALRTRSVVASFLRMAELLRLHDRSWVCCCGWSRFGCAILDDCLWIRGLRSKSSDLMFVCVILGLLRQSLDSRFAQQNLRMARIRTLRLIYILQL